MLDVAAVEEELGRVLSASPRDAAAGAEVLERAVAACRADPEARAGCDRPSRRISLPALLPSNAKEALIPDLATIVRSGPL